MAFEFIDQRAQLYAERYTTPPGLLEGELVAHTRATHPKAHMLSDAVQGRLLEMISCMIQPRRVLEIGTFTGYSTLCLAKGMTPDGRLHTIEMRESDARVAQEYFNLSGLQHQISLHTGNAMDIIPGIRETWDLVFIDADKVHYIDYYRMVCPQVRPGGIIIADNVLFHGEVLQDNLKGKNATAIQSFNDYIQQDETVEKVMLTVRDGLLLIRKK